MMVREGPDVSIQTICSVRLYRSGHDFGKVGTGVRLSYRAYKMPLKDIDARRIYQRNYQRVWIRKRREDFFADKLCARCGSATDLELDHVNPALKVSHNIWSWRRERRETELAKCQVLCRKCHVTKTWTDDYPAPHGAGGQYEKHGCRCSSCRAWKSAKNARYRRWLLTLISAALA